MLRRCRTGRTISSIMLQERTIADKMDRQLTHRGAARSVIALAAMLAHEIKNPCRAFAAQRNFWNIRSATTIVR